MLETKNIISEFEEYIRTKSFSCIAAKAALAKDQIKCMVATHMACPADDYSILNFLYSFINNYRSSEKFYHSAAIIFKQPNEINEPMFEELLWQRLQSLSDMDAKKFNYDKRVSNDPSSPDFSFSLKEEAFFIIGLHPANSRMTRQFKYPTIVFNPHVQFEQLRKREKYENLKYAVRKRDVAFSGSINPMLQDFGAASETYQYSGKKYNNEWRCPLNIKHERY